MPVGTHFFSGLVLAWVFFKLQRLWPLVFAHAALNVFLDLSPYWFL